MTPTKVEAVSPLRRRMIEDMSVRKFGEKTQHDYIRHIEVFAKFLGRSPDTATGEDLRRYQVHQAETGVGASDGGMLSSGIPAEKQWRAPFVEPTSPAPDPRAFLGEL